MFTGRRRSFSLGTAIALTAIILLFVPDLHFAQDVANGLAVANVLTGLSVTAVQDLDFGDVLQGVAKSVPNNDAANSGVFRITGEPGAGISVYMTLPIYLATATGDDRMDVAFGITDCSIDSTGNSDPSAFGDGWQDVNPYSLPSTLTIGSAIPSQSAIFLGGRVIPSVDQTSGPYSGDIIVTVAYNGT
jgi:hypothetical protein